MINSGLIATQFDGGLGDSFLGGRKRRKRLQEFVARGEAETFLCHRFVDGTERLDRVADARDVKRADASTLCAQVTTAGIACELSYAALRDREGTEFDLVVVGTWKIGAPRAFLREYGLERLRTAGSIEVTCLETTLAKRCRRTLTEEAQTVTYEDLRNRKQAAEEILRRAQEIEQETKQRLQAIEKAKEEQARAAALTKQVSPTGLSVMERFGAAVAGMSTGTMRLLGKTAGPAYLAQVLREKAAAYAEAVLMKKVEIRSRDVGGREVNTLAINSPLCFGFLSGRGGYATVLNIGTSGKVYLQSPNAFVGIEQGQVEAQRQYQVPGAELLPAEELQRNGLAYVEVGPPGWEELIVLVSEEPLMTDADLLRSTADNPFVALSAQRIEQLLNQLAEAPEDGWNVGVLSFLVE